MKPLIDKDMLGHETRSYMSYNMATNALGNILTIMFGDTLRRCGIRGELEQL